MGILSLAIGNIISHIPHTDTPSGPAFLRQPTETKCWWVDPGIPKRSLWPPDHTHQTSDKFWGNYHTSPPLPPSLSPDPHVECGNTWEEERAPQPQPEQVPPRQTGRKRQQCTVLDNVCRTSNPTEMEQMTDRNWQELMEEILPWFQMHSWLLQPHLLRVHLQHPMLALTWMPVLATLVISCLLS